MKVSELIDIYVSVLRARGLRPKITKATTRHSLAFLTWCTSQGIGDALVEPYIRARHAAIGYRRVIRIDRLKGSAQFVSKFLEFGSTLQLHEMAQERHSAEATDHVPNGNSHFAETVKRVWIEVRDCPEACWYDRATTWGPRSKWCQQCPLQEGCRDYWVGHGVVRPESEVERDQR